MLQTSAGTFAQNETEWTPWLRTLAGLRVDGYRFDVDAGDHRERRDRLRRSRQPEGRRGLRTVRQDGDLRQRGPGLPQQRRARRDDHRRSGHRRTGRRVTPLARATGAEVGIRTVRMPRLQMTFTAWTLGARFRARIRRRRGHDRCRPAQPPPGNRVDVTVTDSRRDRPWLVLDADLALSRARFTDADPAGDRIPGAVATVVSAGATVDSVSNVFGSVRWRYFGPRALVEDDSVRSKATSLVNLTAGYKLTPVGTGRARRVQSLQPSRQRHRLLLPLAPSRRTRRRHRRFARSSCCAAECTSESCRGVLRVTVSVGSLLSSVASRSPQSQSSVVSQSRRLSLQSSRQSESTVRVKVQVDGPSRD